MDVTGKKGASPSVAEIFSTMEYGPAPEADNVVQAWLEDHGRAFGHFIDNNWIKPDGRETTKATSPCDGKLLATTIRGTAEDVDLGVKAARKAYESWGQLSGNARARHLYSLARHLQKHHRLLSVLEALDNGKTIRETRDADVPTVIRHLYHYAGWAELMDEKMSGNWSSIGVVGAIVPWNFPLMLLTWKVAPALAVGNTVVLKPASATRLSALLFAEICAEAGIPPGVFNVVTGDGAMGQELAEHPDVDKVGFTGSTEVGKILRRATAGTGKKLSLELGGKSPVIVYDTADLDSAVESIIDAIWFNQGQVCSAGSKLLLQQTIFDKFIAKIKARLSHYRIGHSLDKAVDMGALINESQKKSVAEYVEGARKEGAEIFQIDCPKGCFYPPTLITNVNTASSVVMEEIFGPVLVALPFRTEKEAVALANNTMYGLAASVHSDKLPLALETAKQIKAGTVWLNCHNLFDAAVGFGGYKQSGFGRDGGQEGLYEYVKPAWKKKVRHLNLQVDLANFGAVYMGDLPHAYMEEKPFGTPKVDHTYKLYYGGLQKRPDAMYSAVVRNSSRQPVALVGQSNRKDVRNAVEAAKKAQAGWDRKTGFNRAQILYYIAENLELRKDEFSSKLEDMGFRNGMNRVDKSVARLFYWAAIADKFGGTVQEAHLYGTVIKIHEPIGVIGIACPVESPLLGFISLIAPAIARGNSVVVVPSQENPLPALDMYQIFDTSDLPGGVVNILSGARDHVTKYLTEHQDVDAMWYFGSKEGSKFVEHTSSVNVKRTWVNYGETRGWFDDKQGQGEEFLYHSVQAKNIWLSMGEQFAN